MIYKCLETVYKRLRLPRHNSLTHRAEASSPKGGFCRSQAARREEGLAASSLLLPSPAAPSQRHPGPSTPSWAGAWGRGRKMYRLESIRQTPPQRAGSRPVAMLLRSPSCSGVAAPVARGSSAQLSSIRHLPAPAALRRAPPAPAGAARAALGALSSKVF